MPSVPLIARVYDKPGTLAGHPVPAGTEVVVPIFEFHHSEEHWEDNWNFEPDRFLGHEGARVPACAVASHMYCAVVPRTGWC